MGKRVGKNRFTILCAFKGGLPISRELRKYDIFPGEKKRKKAERKEDVKTGDRRDTTWEKISSCRSDGAAAPRQPERKSLRRTRRSEKIAAIRKLDPNSRLQKREIGPKGGFHEPGAKMEATQRIMRWRKGGKAAKS